MKTVVNHITLSGTNMLLSNLTDEQLSELAEYRRAQTEYHHGLALKNRRRGAWYGELLKAIQAEVVRRKGWLESGEE